MRNGRHWKPGKKLKMRETFSWRRGGRDKGVQKARVHPPWALHPMREVGYRWIAEQV